MTAMKYADKDRLISAINNYFSHGFFILFAYFIYTTLPYYQNLLNKTAQDIINTLVTGYFIFGFPYFFIRNLLFFSWYAKEKSKPEIIVDFLLALPQKLVYLISVRPQKSSFYSLQITPTVRTAVLSLVVKLFYFPLLLSFFLSHFASLKSLLLSLPQTNIFSYLSFATLHPLIFQLIFTIDTLIFTLGYFIEAKWLKNEIKSVDPYLSGWVVTLICYPPFNSVVDRFLSVPATPAISFFTLGPVAVILQLLALFGYFIYVWATIALLAKSSNLTNRGIVSHGPYRFIRHPAYIGKNLAWWLETLPYLSNPLRFAPLIFWTIIYFLRALTEERHLLSDPDYRRYVKKVPWRFLPKII